MNSGIERPINWYDGLEVKSGEVVLYKGSLYKSLFGEAKANPEDDSDYIYVGEFKKIKLEINNL